MKFFWPIYNSSLVAKMVAKKGYNFEKKVLTLQKWQKIHYLYTYAKVYEKYILKMNLQH